MYDDEPTIALGQFRRALVTLHNAVGNVPVSEGLTNPHSWRGDYSQVAFEPTFGPQPLNELVDVVTSAVGATFTGWKGGEFVMHENVHVHVAHEGQIGSPGALRILGHALLSTSYRKADHD